MGPNAQLIAAGAYLVSNGVCARRREDTEAKFIWGCQVSEESANGSRRSARCSASCYASHRLISGRRSGKSCWLLLFLFLSSSVTIIWSAQGGGATPPRMQLHFDPNNPTGQRRMAPRSPNPSLQPHERFSRVPADGRRRNEHRLT